MRVRLGLALIASVVVLAACTAQDNRGVRLRPTVPAPGASGLGDSYYPGLGNGGYDVRHYRLALKYEPDTDRLTGHATLTAQALHPLSRFNLDFGPLEVSSLLVNGAAATWRRGTETELEVTPPSVLGQAAAFTIEMRYTGAPGGNGVNRGFIRTPDGAVVAGEPEAASDWFPSNDHPRDKATYEFAIEVPEGLTAIANGIPDGSATAGGWTTWRWRETVPMASYLATMAVGRFRMTVGTAAGVPMVLAVAESVPATQTDAALGRTGEITEYLATLFGPYPFDAVGGTVPDAPGMRFALENQTRPTYSAAFFANGSVDDKTSVIAHEIAHQWFGDSVSVHDWRDIWLNEGLATYAQWLWAQQLGRETAQQRFDREYNIIRDLWSTPPGDPGVGNLFHPSVYQRGAMVAHALRMVVGDDAFFRILKEWTATYRHSTATTAQFIEIAERIGDRQLDSLFQDWLYGTKRPPYPPKE
jgi:aminopeptidase N